jgi:two-component system response regulator RegA
MTDLQSPSLLLVDDDAVFVRTLARAMDRRGYSVTAVTTFAEGQASIAASPPAYAVFDLRLDTGNGLELLAQLHAARPDARVIILTGYGNVATAVAAAKLGVAEYLAKPTDADAIDSALRTPGRPLTPQQTFKRPDDQEFDYLLTMFERHDRNMSETARAIGMHRRTLQRILRRHGVAPADKSEPVSTTRRARRLFRLWRRLVDGGAPTTGGQAGPSA